MKVQRFYEILEQLITEGFGDLELVAEDTRDGTSSSVSIYNTVKAVEEVGAESGPLCEMEPYTRFVPVYLDH